MATFDRQRLKKSPRLAFVVSDHAMTRFRERVEEEFTHRGHDDLADLLNTRLRGAGLIRLVVDPREPTLPTTLYLFESRSGERQVAVVRESCVVTVLDEWMAQNNYPGWDARPIATLGATPLGDKLRAITIARTPAPAPAPPALLTTTPALLATAPTLPAPASAPLAPAPLAPVPPPDEYLVLAAECRELAAKGRALREQKLVLEDQLLAVMTEVDEVDNAFSSKRDRLLALMTATEEKPCGDGGGK